MIKKLQARLDTTKSEEGFTLIELMIVVVIIGILAAIAIPVFANQQKAAIDARTVSDVRTAINVVNSWKASNPTARQFPGDINPGSGNTLKALQTYSEGSVIALWGTPMDYCIRGHNVNGDKYNNGPNAAGTPGTYYLFTSATGKGGAPVTGGFLTALTCGGGNGAGGVDAVYKMTLSNPPV